MLIISEDNRLLRVVSMDIATTLAIAFGLAMDAFAVSVAGGTGAGELRIRKAVKMATSFGAFQTFMPVIGWLAGTGLLCYISSFDHWIAFGLLTFVGCKMIYEATRAQSENKKTDYANNHVLLMLSVATSIDALAVGLAFAFLEASILPSVALIGIITFLLSLTGSHMGSRLGHLTGSKIEVLGGLILITLGLKIVLEHLA
jgi:putative Mn2+ efflux pump MntP